MGGNPSGWNLFRGHQAALKADFSDLQRYDVVTFTDFNLRVQQVPTIRYLREKLKNALSQVTLSLFGRKCLIENSSIVKKFEEIRQFHPRLTHYLPRTTALDIT